ncbi:DUF2304 domain-containing protein [bacterium]|nr:DUF2304 domain-containing protein [bacterium]
MNNTVNIDIIQYIAILGSVVFLVFIIELVRKKTLKEAYSLLWFFFALLFFCLSIWRQGLEVFSRLVGIAYPPAALFLVLLLALFFILIQFSVIISGLSEHNKTLVQEMGLMKLEVETLKNMIKSKHRTQPIKKSGLLKKAGVREK